VEVNIPRNIKIHYRYFPTGVRADAKSVVC